MMGEEQYRIQLKHGIQTPKVSVTPFLFYPKFAPYKPLLLKQIGASLPQPTFSRHSSIKAKVSHVAPMGHVYFQLDQPSIKYIDILIQKFVSNPHQLTHHIHVSQTADCVVLIYDVESNKYKRAKIIAVERDTTKYKCFCIDTGDTRSVDAVNVFRVHETSMLCYYPGQAVSAMLQSVTDLESTTFERIKAILTIGADVQVRAVDQQGKLAIVTVYKQSINVNAIVRLQLEQK